MDLIKLQIPAAFVRDRCRLTWREIRYGLDEELLAPDAPIDFAMTELAAVGEPPDALVELAAAGKGEATRHLVDELADAEPDRDSAEIRDKWLYLVLAWIFENRANFPSPLQTVEEVYADFGYPSEIVGFVRYMPTSAPSLGDRQLNEQRLYENWRQYLVDAAAKFAPSK